MKKIALDNNDLKDLLDELHDKYNRPAFIESDPISIPHNFSSRYDIEISAFLSAILAWGQRSQIIKNANWFMNLMDNEPYNFVVNASENELKRIEKFYYRTFQAVDALFFIHALRHIYSDKGGLESIFSNAYNENNSIVAGLESLYDAFVAVPHEIRSMKHLANIRKGSSAKRLNMFLRWMVRKDNRGVDFGLWKEIPASALIIPLDVHSGTIAREMGLLHRKQNDWKAVSELTSSLRLIDADDPVKYDFALFGFGVNR